MTVGNANDNSYQIKKRSSSKESNNKKQTIFSEEDLSKPSIQKKTLPTNLGASSVYEKI